MERQLGRSGVEVSAMGLGCWTIDGHVTGFPRPFMPKAVGASIVPTVSFRQPCQRIRHGKSSIKRLSALLWLTGEYHWLRAGCKGSGPRP
jgi:hypothetical protein